MHVFVLGGKDLFCLYLSFAVCSLSSLLYCIESWLLQDKRNVCFEFGSCLVLVGSCEQPIALRPRLEIHTCTKLPATTRLFVKPTCCCNVSVLLYHKMQSVVYICTLVNTVFGLESGNEIYTFRSLQRLTRLCFWIDIYLLPALEEQNGPCGSWCWCSIYQDLAV